MPKHANLKPPGRCIFCGALGVTQEHMWANWLRSYIPRELKRHATSVEKVHPRNTEQNIQTRTGDPHSRRIKCVCRACNNGWMSRLQENAKPFLVPMLEGNAITLRRLGQTTLAAWVAMMVMVSEHLHDEMVAIPAADRQWLRANLRPPSHWRIWIGRHAAVTHPLFTHNIVSFAPEKEIERLGLAASLPANSQTSTILLGKHLLIYVMSSASPAALSEGGRSPLQSVPALRRFGRLPPTRLLGRPETRSPICSSMGSRSTSSGRATNSPTSGFLALLFDRRCAALIARPPRAGLSATHYIVLPNVKGIIPEFWDSLNSEPLVDAELTTVGR